VIADARDMSLDQAPTPEFFIPIEQTPPPVWAGLQGSLVVVARTAVEPGTMETPIRRAVDAIDPSLPVANVATMGALVKTSRASARFNTLLFSALGAVALLLASVGVYGMVAYSVSQRTREIGVRMALGATPTTIAALIVGRGLVPIGIGAIAGGVLAAATTRVLRDQLYGVAPGDPATILSIGALLLAVSLLAAGLPTMRAMQTSPTTALAS
jgi:putative ABC transport system permease protein